MITRIVKMKFKESEKESFKTLFYQTKPLILSFPGCNNVKLLQDRLFPNIIFTLSNWNTHEDLESYRNSELFLSTWSVVKQMFDGKPEAWSLEEENYER